MPKNNPNSMSEKIRQMPDRPAWEVAKILGCNPNLVSVVRTHELRGRARDRGNRCHTFTSGIVAAEKASPAK